MISNVAEESKRWKPFALTTPPFTSYNISVIYVTTWPGHVVYYETAQGDKPIEAFLDALSHGARAKCLAYISRLESDGTRLPSSIAAHVRGKLWELRPEWSGTEYRFFYAALVGQRFIILHAIQKKRQKLRERDIVLAEQRYEDVKRRSRDENA